MKYYTFVCVQLESRWPQAGECLHGQHRVPVGRPDWRLRPEVPLPLAHPQTAVPPQRHVSDLAASGCALYIRSAVWFSSLLNTLGNSILGFVRWICLDRRPIIKFVFLLFYVNTKLCLYFRDKVLVCPMKSAPVLLTLSDSKHVVLPVDDDSDLNVVAAFDRRGEYIYTGNAKGKVSPFWWDCLLWLLLRFSWVCFPC